MSPITLDHDLGWRATENYQERLTDTTRGGTRYQVHRSQKRYGFRQFGNLQSSKPKLLMIGDYFTQATAVSDDQTYYALAGKMLGLEVFAHEAARYGTLERGKTGLTPDEHWNEGGHQLAAGMVVKHMKERDAVVAHYPY